jgi:2-polyprenyl-6-methoxyphenol hydroxylase-like FAD-dependent oxidoreductase
MPAPTTAIVGAGPAGLTLARLLHIKNIPYTLYELEASPNVRTQGGTLDLHESSGQRAIKAAGLYSEFQKVSRPEGEALRLTDKTGKLWVDHTGEKGERNKPEIDRIQLRKLLLDSIPPQTIRWGSKVTGVEGPSEDSQWTVTFVDGTKSEPFDLVIGADGAWSKVRPALTEASPYYSGISGIEVRFDSVDQRQPKISKLVGKGSYFAFCDNKGMLAQRSGNGSIRNYALMRVPEDWASSGGIDLSNPAETKTKILEQYFSDWDESLHELVLLADDDSIIPRTLYMLPVGVNWESRPGVTLVGDAAHLMTPFAGVGVNIAMQDAQELAEAIERGQKGGDLSAAVKEYEVEMFKRGKKNAELSLRGTNNHFSDTAPKQFMERLAGHKTSAGDKQ